MGSVGNFLFGGGQQKNNSSSSGNEVSSSQQQSQNANVSGSDSSSTNVSGSNNQAYGPISAALTPSLGYVTQAGNMMGALLGLPPSNFSYKTSAPSPLPAAPAQPSSDIMSTLLNKYLSSAAAATPPTAAPTPTPTPTPAPGPAPVPVSGGGGGGSGIGIPVSSYSQTASGGPGVARTVGGNVNYTASRAEGGSIPGGTPTLVGEQGPEVFVPHGNGTVVPNGAPSGVDPIMSPGGGGTGAPLQGFPGVPGINLGDLTGRFGGGFGNGGYGGRFGGGPVGGGPIPGHPAPPPAGVPPTGTPANPANTASSALNTFANSAGEQFLLDQGQKAISGASAGNGTFDSGATGKALTQYGQNLGSTYLNDYLNNLSNYAKIGLGSASAMTGAGGQSAASGGSNSSSLGFGSGSSSGSSNLTSSQQSQGTGSGNQKNGLLPDLAKFGSGSGSGG